MMLISWQKTIPPIISALFHLVTWQGFKKKKQKTKRGHCDGQGRGELHSETYDSKNETLLIVLKIKKDYENGALNIISFYGLPKTSNISFYGIPHCRTSEKLTIMCKNGFLWDFLCNIIMNNSYSKKQLLNSVCF